MTIVTGITSQPKQQMTLQIADGTQASFYLEYREQQTGWFWDLTWGAHTINGNRLTTFPNILRQWKNILPFGLSVVAPSGVDPLNPTDFIDGTIFLLQLTASDVVVVEQTVFPGT